MITHIGWFLISYDVIPQGGGGHNGNATGNKLLCMKKQERKPRMHQWRLLCRTLSLNLAGQASRSNPAPTFHSWMQNDITTVLVSLITFCKKPYICYLEVIVSIIPGRIKALLLRRKNDYFGEGSAMLRQPFGRQLRPPQQKRTEGCNKKINHFINTSCSAAVDLRHRLLRCFYCGATVVAEAAIRALLYGPVLFDTQLHYQFQRRVIPPCE